MSRAHGFVEAVPMTRSTFEQKSAKGLARMTDIGEKDISAEGYEIMLLGPISEQCVFWIPADIFHWHFEMSEDE